MALRIWRMIMAVCVSLKNFFYTIMQNSQLPQQTSVTKYIVFYVQYTSQSFMMLGWSSFLSNDTSVANISLSMRSSLDIVLTALRYPVTLCCARNTTPNPPEPNSLTYSQSSLIFLFLDLEINSSFLILTAFFY